VQPRLDPAVAVHAKQVLRGPEVPHPAVKFLETVERAEQEVEVLGKGDVLDVAEADGDAFDVNAGSVGGIAEIFAVLVVEVLGVDDAVLALPPLEDLEVALELGQRVETQQVLLQLLVGQVVHQDTETPLLRTHLTTLPPLSPALLLQRWRFVQPRLSAPHNITNNGRAGGASGWG
jgi:hypothetical protein